MQNHPPPAPVDILLVGNVTRDLIDPEDFTRYRLGGTVTFAAVVAAKLGRRPTIVTHAAPDTDFSVLPPETDLRLLPSATTTTFANIYTPHGRVQYCFTPAPVITVANIPSELRHPRIALLGPIADEIAPDVAAVFGDSTLVAAVPQGWMRRWDEKGRVRSKRWESAREILPSLDAVIASLEDIDYDWARLAPIFAYAPLVVSTEYRDGSTVFRRHPGGGVSETKVPPRPANEVDPTGAGDTFTTSFLIHLQETGDPFQAARFANIAASMSVEHEGTSGIPSRDMILRYMDEHPFSPDTSEQSKF